MTFRTFIMRASEPASIWLMVIGVVALCQPWLSVLHIYATTITLVGIVGFNIAAHLPPADAAKDDDHG